MKSLGKAYFRDRKVKIFRIVLLIAVIGILFFQLHILEMLGKEPRIYAGLNFMFGVLFISIFNSFDKSLFRPVIRICDHFLIRNYDQEVVSWNQITSVKLKGDMLVFKVPEAKFWKKFYISTSFIPDKKTLVDDIKKTCESKGIPFEIE